MAADRLGLRATFDSAAHLYQQSRPDYPEELYHEHWGAVLQVARRRASVRAATAN